MHTRRLIFKGGYGEHGRSCFLVQYTHKNRYYMVDCGIMDSEVFPCPSLSEEEVQAVDYLFITHCHKDHTGAVQYMIEKGFTGWLITSRMTVELAALEYDKILYLPTEHILRQQRITLESMQIEYGRSGHCPGGLWFLIQDVFGSSFFSGDYQADTLLYACDSVKGIKADLAIIDCAHHRTEKKAGELRQIICEEVKNLLTQDRKVIFPVPKFGRGIEIFYMLKQTFPQLKIKVDEAFVQYGTEMLAEKCWYKEESLEIIHNLLADRDNILQISSGTANDEDFDILLIADTHLQKQNNAEFAEHIMKKGGILVITGRIKQSSLPEKLYMEGKAVKYLYPHHQSKSDLLQMLQENSFKAVYPYHNPLTEVYLSK